ncbi:hypothetical protein NG799_29010 [Laspinema sp. D1]|uniref:Uncharacterized protein n=1 Tax=Laspinema palackyanum D2a TaxID=2953684 RepID=A0ABT2N024_9CYAN|nr:hypothetical protein [Laspinema sp. D3c]MCT7970358.1 hypothetical protein [Laspinema sp. D2a]MCT7997172.1 hypothetical protein [Laspinema sp. D3c]
MRITKERYSKPSLRRWTTFVVRDGETGCIYLRELVDCQMGKIFLKISEFNSIQKAHRYARTLRAEYGKKNANEVLDILTSKIGGSSKKSRRNSRKKVSK